MKPMNASRERSTPPRPLPGAAAHCKQFPSSGKIRFRLLNKPANRIPLMNTHAPAISKSNNENLHTFSIESFCVSYKFTYKCSEDLQIKIYNKNEKLRTEWVENFKLGRGLKTKVHSY